MPDNVDSSRLGFVVAVFGSCKQGVSPSRSGYASDESHSLGSNPLPWPSNIPSSSWPDIVWEGRGSFTASRGRARYCLRLPAGLAHWTTAQMRRLAFCIHLLLSLASRVTRCRLLLVSTPTRLCEGTRFHVRGLASALDLLGRGRAEEWKEWMCKGCGPWSYSTPDSQVLSLIF